MVIATKSALRSTVQRILPLVGHFKFSVGRAARVKLGPASIGRSLSYGKVNYLAVAQWASKNQTRQRSWLSGRL